MERCELQKSQGVSKTLSLKDVVKLGREASSSIALGEIHCAMGRRLSEGEQDTMPGQLCASTHLKMR